ncbi:MAG: VOC family protein [Proteobacteria bacterium]|nr:VOC family protein [Pseudomonadota bacterium]
MKYRDRNSGGASKVTGPPKLTSFDHASMPSHDVAESIRFYGSVLGGELVVKEDQFALFKIAGTRIGIGSSGTTFMTENAEYPHIAFNIGPDALVRMKDWLTACGVPTSNFWTRKGIETLMFFRDPSGNVIELFCDSGYDGAADLPRGPARGHGITLDIDELRYTHWHIPADGS